MENQIFSTVSFRRQFVRLESEFWRLVDTYAIHFDETLSDSREGQSTVRAHYPGTHGKHAFVPLAASLLRNGVTADDAWLNLYTYSRFGIGLGSDLVPNTHALHALSAPPLGA